MRIISSIVCDITRHHNESNTIVSSKKIEVHEKKNQPPRKFLWLNECCVYCKRSIRQCFEDESENLIGKKVFNNEVKKR